MTQQINLYDPTLELQRDWLALSNVVAAGVLLLVVVGTLGYLTRKNLPALVAQSASNEAQLKMAREQITALGQQIAGRQPDPRLAQELGAMQLLLSARGEVLTTLKQRLGPEADAFAEYLRGFARQSVPGLWLTGFNFNASSGGMEIHGRTIDPALLPEYIRRLNNEPAFRGRAFASLKLAAGKSEPLPGGTTTAGAASTTTADSASTTTADSASAKAATAKPPFHEFTLIPVKADGSSQAGNPALPLQTSTTAGAH